MLPITLRPHMAEAVGFELTGLFTPNRFQDGRLKPLGQTSIILPQTHVEERLVFLPT